MVFWLGGTTAAVASFPHPLGVNARAQGKVRAVPQWQGGSSLHLGWSRLPPHPQGKGAGRAAELVCAQPRLWRAFQPAFLESWSCPGVGRRCPIPKLLASLALEEKMRGMDLSLRS